MKRTSDVAVHQLELVGGCVLDVSGCLLGKDGISLMLRTAPHRTAPAAAADLVRIDIGASSHIRELKMAVVQNGEEEQLVAQQRTRQTDRWFVEFPRTRLTQVQFTVRIALAQTKRVYLAEFPARFH